MFSFHLVSSPSGVSENVEYWAPTAESSVEVIVTMGGVVVVLEVKGGEREGGKGEGGKRYTLGLSKSSMIIPWI